MATLDAANVKIPRLGGLFSAPLGTPWPVDTATPLPAEWKAWGYLGSEGIGRAISSTSTDITAFQDNEVVATINSESSATYTIPSLETRAHIIEAVWGTEVVSTSEFGTYVIDPSASKPRLRFVAELVDKRDMSKERQLFEAETLEVGEQTYVSTDAIILTPTLKVFGSITVIDDKLKTVTPA